MNAKGSTKEDADKEFHKIRFAKRSFLLMSSSILRIAVQLGIVFLYSRKLSLFDYGLYQSVWLYISLASVISLFGLPALILTSSLNNIRHYAATHKKQFILFAVLLNLLPLLYIFFTADEFTLLQKLLLFVLITVQNISIITETICIKKELERLVLITNVIFINGYLLLHLLLLYNGYSLLLLLGGLIFLFLFKLIAQFLFSRSFKSNAEDTGSSHIGKQWVYLGLYDVLGIAARWLDKWFILSFISISQFAIYFNGAYEIPVFGLMVSAVGNIMLTELSKKNTALVTNIKILFEKSTTFLASFVFPAFCFLFFYHSDFFLLLFSSKYEEAIPVFLIGIFVLPVRITNSAAALQACHRNDLIVKGAVLDLLIAVVLMMILYPLFKLNGLAAAFVISTYIQVGYYLWHTGKIINKSISYFFPFKKLLVMLCMAIVVSGGGYYIFKGIAAPFTIVPGIMICSLLVSVFLHYYYKKQHFK